MQREKQRRKDAESKVHRCLRVITGDIAGATSYPNFGVKSDRANVEQQSSAPLLVSKNAVAPELQHSCSCLLVRLPLLLPQSQDER